MTRGQLRRSLAVEALLISLVSGISGVLLGTLFGWLGAYVVFSMYGKVVFPFEWGINGIVLAVAAVAALLASVFPARRAVSTPPVERSPKPELHSKHNERTPTTNMVESFLRIMHTQNNKPVRPNGFRKRTPPPVRGHVH